MLAARRVLLLSLLLVGSACSSAGGGAAGSPATAPGNDAGTLPDPGADDGGAPSSDAGADAPYVPKDAGGLYGSAEGLADDALKQALYALIKDQTALGYDGARDAMFGTTSQFDVHNGMLECIYTGRLVAPNGTRIPGGFNTEHSWPQSLGASTEPARSDLHHIFPVDDAANNARGNFPFGDTDCSTTCGYQNGGSKLGARTGGAETVFQVRAERQGDIARAQFYFSVRYQLPIPQTVEPTLRQWHQADPVDALEQKRNDDIDALQHNRNPFVDRPDFVGKISDY